MYLYHCINISQLLLCSRFIPYLVFILCLAPKAIWPVVVNTWPYTNATKAAFEILSTDTSNYTALGNRLFLHIITQTRCTRNRLQSV